MYDEQEREQMAPSPEQRAQPVQYMQHMQRPQGQGIDWGAIVQRMRQRFGQRHPGMLGLGGQMPQAQPPVGAPPAAPQMDRGRLMGIAQNWGQQQPGGIVPPNWRGGQY